MNIPLRCKCGTVQGEVDPTSTYSRAVCYCHDCQAYAQFLGRREEMLDTHGGTDIVATAPSAVRFSAGLDQLACMSLSDHGILRWYASCCRTPIGNTPRDVKTAYVGLVHNCLSANAAALASAFGRPKIVLNAGSAKGKVASTPLALLPGILRIVRRIVGARWSGRWRDNPFFHADSAAPVREPLELNPSKRAALDVLA